MKTIFITVSRGGIIRNLFHTGVIRSLLERGVKVVVLTPYYTTPELFDAFKHEHLFIEPLFWEQHERLRGALKELFKGAVFNSSVYARYRYSIGTRRQPNQFLLPLRMAFFAPLKHIPGIKRFLRFMYARVNPLRAHDYLFEKYKPDLVFNTASGADCGLLNSAKRFGVTTVDMPKSWDNVSQSLFPTKADFLIVWNDFTRQKALELQGYSPEEIIVTGVPQFDFYAREDGLLSREAFCKKHNFDPKKKIILYGSGGAELFDETKHVRLIQEYMKQGLIEEANILVRPHLGYKGDVERFAVLQGEEGLSVDTSDKQDHRLRDHFDISIDHVYNLFNSLYHAQVCVNSASTISLDALACGKPVVNFNFDVDESVEENDSVERLFVSDYIRALMETRGTWLAQNKEEFLKILKGILENRDERNTKKTIDHFIYKSDGKSAERLAHALLEILSAKS